MPKIQLVKQVGGHHTFEKKHLPQFGELMEFYDADNKLAEIYRTNEQQFVLNHLSPGILDFLDEQKITRFLQVDSNQQIVITQEGIPESVGTTLIYQQSEIIAEVIKTSEAIAINVYTKKAVVIDAGINHPVILFQAKDNNLTVKRLACQTAIVTAKNFLADDLDCEEFNCQIPGEVSFSGLVIIGKINQACKAKQFFIRGESKFTLKDGQIVADNFHSQGYTNLQEATIACDDKVIFSENSQLIANRSKIIGSYIDVCSQGAELKDSELEADHLFYSPLTSQFQHGLLHSVFLELGGENHFTETLMHFSTLNVTGFQNCKLSRCVGREDATLVHSIHGILELDDSHFLSQASIVIEPEGKLKLQGKKAFLEAHILIKQGNFEILHQAQVILLSEVGQGELVIKNSALHLHGDFIDSGEQAYSNSSIHAQKIKIGGRIHVDKTSLFASEDIMSLTKSVLIGLGNQIKSNQKLILAGDFFSKDTSLTSPHIELFARGELLSSRPVSAIEIDNKVTAHTILESPIYAENIHNSGKLCVADNVKLNGKFEATHYATTSFQGSQLIASDIILAGAITASAKKTEKGYSHPVLFAANNFKGDLFATITSEKDAYFQIRSSTVQNHADFVGERVRLEANKFVNSGRLTINSLDLYFNHSGLNQSTIECQNISIVGPYWQNDFWIQAKEQYTSRTLCETPGLVQTKLRNRKTLVTNGIFLPILILPEFKDIFKNLFPAANILLQNFLAREYGQLLNIASTAPSQLKIVVNALMNMYLHIYTHWNKHKSIKANVLEVFNETPTHTWLLAGWECEAVYQAVSSLQQLKKMHANDVRNLQNELGNYVKKIKNSSIKDVLSDVNQLLHQSSERFKINFKAISSSLETVRIEAASQWNNLQQKVAVNLEGKTSALNYSFAFGRVVQQSLIELTQREESQHYFKNILKFGLPVIKAVIPTQMDLSLCTANFINFSISNNSRSIFRLNIGVDVNAFQDVHSVYSVNLGVNSALCFNLTGKELTNYLGIFSLLQTQLSVDQWKNLSDTILILRNGSATGQCFSMEGKFFSITDMQFIFEKSYDVSAHVTVQIWNYAFIKSAQVSNHSSTFISQRLEVDANVYYHDGPYSGKDISVKAKRLHFAGNNDLSTIRLEGEQVRDSSKSKCEEYNIDKTIKYEKDGETDALVIDVKADEIKLGGINTATKNVQLEGKKITDASKTNCNQYIVDKTSRYEQSSDAEITASLVDAKADEIKLAGTNNVTGNVQLEGKKITNTSKTKCDQLIVEKAASYEQGSDAETTASLVDVKADEIKLAGVNNVTGNVQLEGKKITNVSKTKCDQLIVEKAESYEQGSDAETTASLVDAKADEIIFAGTNNVTGNVQLEGHKITNASKPKCDQLIVEKAASYEQSSDAGTTTNLVDAKSDEIKLAGHKITYSSKTKCDQFIVKKAERYEQGNDAEITASLVDVKADEIILAGTNNVTGNVQLEGKKIVNASKTKCDQLIASKAVSYEQSSDAEITASLVDAKADEIKLAGTNNVTGNVQLEGKKIINASKTKCDQLIAEKAQRYEQGSDAETTANLVDAKADEIILAGTNNVTGNVQLEGKKVTDASKTKCNQYIADKAESYAQSCSGEIAANLVDVKADRASLAGQNQFQKGTVEAKESVDDSSTTQVQGHYDIKTKDFRHTGRVTGNSFAVTADTGSLTGSSSLKKAHLEIKKLRPGEAAEILQGTGTGKPYEVQQLHLTTDEHIKIDQKFLDESRKIPLSIKAISFEVGKIQYNQVLILSSQQSLTFNQEIRVPGASFQSDQDIIIGATQTGSDGLTFIANGKVELNSNISGGQNVSIEANSFHVRGGASADAKKTEVTTDQGDMIIDGTLAGSDVLKLTMNNKKANYELRAQEPFIIKKDYVHYHWQDQKNIGKGSVHVFLDPNSRSNKSRWQYIAKDKHGKIYTGYIDELPNKDQFSYDLFKRAHKHSTALTNDVINSLNAGIITKHRLNQGKLIGGTGVNNDGKGVDADVGHAKFTGPIKIEAVGDIKFKVTSATFAPGMTKVKDVKKQSGKSVLQKVLGMDRKTVKIQQHVFGGQVISHEGTIDFESQQNMTVTSVLFVSQGTTLSSEEGKVYLVERIANKNRKTTQKILGTRSKHKNQEAVVTEIHDDGDTLIEAKKEEVRATGVLIHGNGNLRIFAAKKIVLSAPILKQSHYMKRIQTVLSVNGIDVLNLNKAFSGTAFALFKQMDLPKEQWLTLFSELCAKEPMIGAIADCIGSENIYEHALNSWRAGILSVNLLNDLARGINKNALLAAIAKRWGVDRADVRLTATLVKQKTSQERVAENAGIFRANVALVSPELELANGVPIVAENLKLANKVIRGKAAKLESRTVTSKKSLWLGANEKGFDIGIEAQRDAVSHKRHQNPTIFVKGKIEFEEVDQLTGNLQIHAGQASGQINNVNLESKEDVTKTSHSSGGINYQLTHLAAAHGIGMTETLSGGKSTLNFSDAKELKVDRAELTGAEIHAPGAEIQQVIGHSLKLSTEKTQIGFSVNPRELAQSFSDEQNKESNPITMINLPLQIVRKEAEQRSVVTGATVYHTEGKVVRNEKDGYKVKKDFKVSATVVIPVTDKERVERFKEESKEAYLKLEAKVKKSFTKFFVEGAEQAKKSDVDKKILLPEEAVMNSPREQEEAEVLLEQKTSEALALVVADSVPLTQSAPLPESGEATISQQDPIELVIMQSANNDGQTKSPANPALYLVDEESSRPTTWEKVQEQFGEVEVIVPVGTEASSKQNAKPGFFKRQLKNIGSLVSDIPVYFIVDKVCKATLTTIKAPALGILAVYGAAVFGSTELVNSSIEAYEAYRKNNSDKPLSFGEFFRLYGPAIAKNVGISAATGAATMTVGGVVSPITKIPMTTVGKVTAHAIKNAAEVTTAVTVSAALQTGEAPSQQDYIDNIATGLIFNATILGCKQVPEVIKNVKEEVSCRRRVPITLLKDIPIAEVVAKLPQEEISHTLKKIMPTAPEQEIAWFSEALKQCPKLAETYIPPTSFLNALSNTAKQFLPFDHFVPGMELGVPFYATSENVPAARITIRKAFTTVTEPVAKIVLNTMKSETRKGNTQLFFKEMADKSLGGQFEPRPTTNEIRISTETPQPKATTAILHESGHLFAEKNSGDGQRFYKTPTQEIQMLNALDSDFKGFKEAVEKVCDNPHAFAPDSFERRIFEHVVTIMEHPEHQRAGETMTRLLEGATDPKQKFLREAYPKTWEYLKNYIQEQVADKSPLPKTTCIRVYLKTQTPEQNNSNEDENKLSEPKLK